MISYIICGMIITSAKGVTPQQKEAEFLAKEPRLGMPLVSSLATKVRDGGSFTSKGIGCGGGSVAWEGVASLRKRRRRLVVYRRSGWRRDHRRWSWWSV